MAEFTREGISVRPDGTKPMAVAMTAARQHPVFLASLSPVPRAAGQRAGNSKVQTSSYSNQTGGKGNRNKPQPGPYSSGGQSPKGGRQAKGKGKSKAKFQRMPAELQGYRASTKSGQRICFDFNLGGCSLSCTSGKCSKGVHECCYCGETGHGLRQCPK